MRLPSPRTLLLPNRNTFGLGAVLLAMWYAGASQNNGAAYLLCFVLASVAAVSALHAWANLRGLTLRAGPIPPVFAGEMRTVALELLAGADRHHAGVRVDGGGGEAIFQEAEKGQPQRAMLQAPAEERGCFEELAVSVSSLFPLGFLTARRRMHLRQTHFVYPHPAGRLPLPRAVDPAGRARAGVQVEGDDFAGLREWRAGESMRHIHWKAVARGQPLMTKQWSGESDDLLLLDWGALAGLEADEERLAQMAQWAVLAERSGAAYGLRLPGVEIAAAQGEAHFHACLRALAAFPREVGG